METSTSNEENSNDGKNDSKPSTPECTSQDVQMALEIVETSNPNVENSNEGKNDDSKPSTSEFKSQNVQMALEIMETASPKEENSNDRENDDSKPSTSEYTLQDVQMALKVEQEFSNKGPRLYLRFPDPPLNVEIVKKLNSSIQYVRLKQSTMPRYCFVDLKVNANVEETIEEISKTPFGMGFLTATLSHKNDGKPSQSNDIDPLALHVNNVPCKPVKWIKQYFPKAVDIDVHIKQRMKPERNAHAFVRYANVDDAIVAFRQLFNAEIEGRTFMVRFLRKETFLRWTKKAETENDEVLKENEMILNESDNLGIASTGSNGKTTKEEISRLEDETNQNLDAEMNSKQTENIEMKRNRRRMRSKENKKNDSKPSTPECTSQDVQMALEIVETSNPNVENSNEGKNDDSKPSTSEFKSQNVQMALEIMETASPKEENSNDRENDDSKPSTSEYTLQDVQMALKVEQEFLNKRPRLYLRFPDPPLNVEIVKKLNSSIQYVRFQQSSMPRFCFVDLKVNANVEETIEEISKTPFGMGFITATLSHKYDCRQSNDIDPLALHVNNVPCKPVKWIKQYFPQAVDIDVHFKKRMKTYAFVRYANVDDAIVAFRQLFNAEIEGRTFMVRFLRKEAFLRLTKKAETENDEVLKENEMILNESDNLGNASTGSNGKTTKEEISRLEDETNQNLDPEMNSKQTENIVTKRDKRRMRSKENKKAKRAKLNDAKQNAEFQSKKNTETENGVVLKENETAEMILNENDKLENASTGSNGKTTKEEMPKLEDEKNQNLDAEMNSKQTENIETKRNRRRMRSKENKKAKRAKLNDAKQKAEFQSKKT